FIKNVSSLSNNIEEYGKLENQQKSLISNLKSLASDIQNNQIYINYGKSTIDPSGVDVEGAVSM
ncbi:MAG: hypothetical protein LUC91_01220, partial [Prevotella sp.]|nr:hypothetical protein [Prevotella sp.]